MKVLNLNANQIISSSHEILHDINVLKIYFRIFQKKCGDIMPPAPVIHKDFIVNYFSDDLKNIWIEFAKQHPSAEYFLLDGSHKTTAADLNHKKCGVMIIENSSNIKEASELERVGEVFKNNLYPTIEEVISNTVRHFNEHKKFQTVEMKTKLLIGKKMIPMYMVQKYIEK